MESPSRLSLLLRMNRAWEKNLKEMCFLCKIYDNIPNMWDKIIYFTSPRSILHHRVLCPWLMHWIAWYFTFFCRCMSSMVKLLLLRWPIDCTSFGPLLWISASEFIHRMLISMDVDQYCIMTQGLPRFICDVGYQWPWYELSSYENICKGHFSIDFSWGCYENQIWCHCMWWWSNGWKGFSYLPVFQQRRRIYFGCNQLDHSIREYPEFDMCRKESASSNKANSRAHLSVYVMISSPYGVAKKHAYHNATSSAIEDNTTDILQSTIDQKLTAS